MSPLIIVGILLSTALADVSHVLSGEAYPSPSVSPIDVNSLSAPKNAFQSGNPNDFWWMSPNSPLKEAYEYFKKCSSKGDCLPPVSVVPGIKVAEAHFDPIDLEKNPFLNGKFQAGFSSSSFSSSSTGCTACGSGSKTSGDIAAFHSGTKIDVSNNPFLNGQFSTAGNGDKIKNENGFLGVQPKKPAFATSHPLTNKKPFPTSLPNAPQSFVLGEKPKGVECRGQGYLCMARNRCISGVLNETREVLQVKNDVQYCNPETEVCCQLTNSQAKISFPNTSGKSDLASTINNLAEITLGKSSVTGSSFKFSGGAGSSPGQIQVLIDQPDEVNPQISHHGESGSQASTNKATRDVTPSGIPSFGNTVDYSGVQISNDVRFGSTIRGPAYLPPIEVPSHPTTSLVCPAGTILTPSGTCESPSTPAPPCPFGTYRTPDGNCERQIISTPPPTTFIETTRLACPVGTILTPSGTCESPSTPAPPCPPGTIRTLNGNCERQIVSTTPASCPFGTLLTPDGNCVAPSPAPTPRQCPPGTFLTLSGICEAPPPPPSPPTPQPCPPGTILTSSGLCEALRTTPRPTCPPGTIQTSSGTCEQIVSSTTPGYEYTPPPCPPGTIRTVTGLCETIIVTTARPQCPLGSYLTPSGECELVRPTTPKPPPQPFAPTASREYLPPVTTSAQYVPSVTKKPYQPSVTSEKPFQSSVTQTQPVTPFRTSQPSVTTSRPFQPSPTKTTKQPSYSQFTTPVSSQPSVTTLRPFQTSPPRTKVLTPSTVCPPGQVVSPSGYGCVYPSTTPRPSFSQVITSRPSQPTTFRPFQPSPTPGSSQKETCLPGQKLSPSGTCEYISSTPGYQYPTPQPPSGRPPTGKPVCAFGQILSPSGECIYPSSPVTPSRQPQCGPGQNLSPSGSCVYSSQSTPTQRPQFPTSPSCKPGQIPAPTGYGCIYPSPSSTVRPFTSTPGYTYTKPSTSCAPGQELSPTGSCVYPSRTTPGGSTGPRPSCGPGQVPKSSGIGCEYPKTPKPSFPSVVIPACPFGTKLNPVTKECLTGSTPTPSFGPSSTTQSSCGPGKILSASGVCTYPSQPQSSCPPGQFKSPEGFCIYPSDTTTINQPTRKPPCGPGLIESGGICVYPSETTPIPKERCNPGEVLSSSGSCVSVPTGTQPTSAPSCVGYNCKYQPSTSRPSRCPPGQVPSISGSGCEYPKQVPVTNTTRPVSCPFGTKLSPITNECITGSTRRPDGYEYPKPSTDFPSGFSSTTKPTSGKQCPFGQSLSPSGICTYPGGTTPSGREPICRPGQTLSDSGTCIYPSQPTRGPQVSTPASCAVGQVLSSSGVCYYPPSPTEIPRPGTKPPCTPGQILSPSGICYYPSGPSPSTPVCAQGQRLSSNGSCIPSQGVYTTPQDYYSTPTPSCRPGQVLSPSGSCISSSQSTPQPGYDYSRPTPSVPGYTTPQPGVKVQCGPGQKVSPSGSCIYSSQSTPRPTATTFTDYSYSTPSRPFESSQTTPRQCRAGQTLSPSGVCIYPQQSTTSGYEYSRPSTPAAPGYPSQGTTPQPDSKIICGPGQELSSSGRCIYPLRPSTKPSCGRGQVLSPSGSCVYPSGPTPGQQTSSGYNYPRPSTPFRPGYSTETTTPQPGSKIICGPGQVLSPSGSCTYSSQTTPQPGYEYPTSTPFVPGYTGQQTTPQRGTKIICGPGQELSASGKCIYPIRPSTKPSCGPGQVFSPSGSCTYSSQTTPHRGYEYSTPGYTGQPTTSQTGTKITCGPGQVLSLSGLCTYSSFTTPRPGYEYSTPTPFAPGYTGQPTTPQRGTKVTCGPGQVLSPSGSCTYSSFTTPRPGYEYSTPTPFAPGYTGQPTTPQTGTKITCGAGQELSPSGKCIYPLRPTGKSSCGPGQELSSSGSCIYSPQTTPRPGYNYSRPTPTVPGYTTPEPGTPCGPGQELSSSGRCIYPLRPTPKPSCGRGQVLSPSGSCIYPSRPTPGPGPTTAPEYTYSTPFESSKITTRKPCGPGQTLSSSGICISATTSGYEYSRPSTPLRPSYPGQPTTPHPGQKITCRPGQEFTESGTCIYPPRPTPKPSCGPGQILSPSGSCIYSPRTTPQHAPTTSPQYVYSTPSSPFVPGQTTVRPTTRRQCGLGQILLPSGVCDYSQDSTGYDYPKPSTPFGPGYNRQPTTPQPGSKITCGSGQVLSSSGTCVYSSQTTPRPGFEYSTSTPQPGLKLTCGPGQELSPSGKCIYPIRPGTKPSCGPGQTLSPSGSCTYSSQTTPQPEYEYPTSTPFVPGYTGQQTTPQRGTKITCGPGQELSPSGKCIYPIRPSTKPSCGPGQVLSPSGSCTYSSQTTPQRGYEYSTPTPFVPGHTGQPTTPQRGIKVTCGPGQVLSPSGSCTYSSFTTPRPGYEYSTPTPFAPGYTGQPTTPQPGSKTTCGPGQVLSPSGSCTYSSFTTPRPGYEYSTPTPLAPGYTGQPTISQPGSKITCGAGQELSPSGKCIYPSRPTGKPSCGPGQVLSPSGSCIYSPQTTPQPGYDYSRPTPTVPGYTTPQPGTPCGPGQEFSPSGRCIYPSRPSPKPSCGRGQVLSPSGSCIYPSRPTPGPVPVTTPDYTYSTPFESSKITTRRPCGPGQTLSPSGICISATTSEYEYSRPSTPLRPSYPGQPTTPHPGQKITCRPGQEFTESGTCIYPPRPTPKPSCSPGQILSPSGSCIYSPRTTPQLAPTTPPQYVYSTPSSPFVPGQTTVRPTTRRQCGLGQILLPSGVCDYPQDSTGYDYPKPSTSFGPGYNRQTTVSQPGREYSTTKPFGPDYTGQPTIPQPGSKITCGPGQVLSPSGSCTYSSFTTPRPGHEYSTPTPFAPGYTGQPTTPQRGTKVTCGPGQILSPSGSCTYSSFTTPRPGYEYSTPTPFAPGYTEQPTKPQPDTKITCGPGQELSPSAKCIYPSRPSSRPSCGPGQVLSPSGSCIYSSQTTPQPGYDYSRTYPSAPGYTTPQQGTPCGPGQELSPSGRCIYPSRPSPKPSCGRGQVLSPSGSCIYPSGPTTGPVPTTAPEYTYSTPSFETKRPCGVGQTLSSSGVCVYSQQTTSLPISTTPGYEYSRPSTPLGPNYTGHPTKPQPGTPTRCQPGQELTDSGTCIYPTRPSPKPSCGPGQVVSPSGSCIYPSRPTPGPFPTTSPEDVYSTPFESNKITTNKQCGFGQVLSPSGICIYSQQSSPQPVPTTPGYEYSRPSTPFAPGYSSQTTPRPGAYTCRPGQELSESGVCFYPPKPNQRPSCGPGQRLSSSGSCIPLQPTPQPSPGVTTGYEYPTTLPSRPYPSQTCGPNQILSSSGTCVYSSRPTGRPCGPGQVLSPSGICISSTPGFPETTLRPTTSRTSLDISGGYKYPRPKQPLEPKPQCPPGSHLSPSGTCQFASGHSPSPTPNYPSPCPEGTVKSPSGLCESPRSPGGQCSFGTRPSSTGSCEPISNPPRPDFGKSCPPGTVRTGSGLCESSRQPAATCPPGSSLSPSGNCQYPSQTPIPGRPNTGNQFTPSYPTKKPYRPEYVESGSFQYPSSQVVPILPTTPQYLPPVTDREMTGSRIENQFITASTSPPIRIPSRTTSRPDNVNAENIINVNRTPVDEPPVGCAAALKCVQEIYCTAEGVVSPVPVVLTKDQEFLRVPTTECRNEETGIIGKCCRDPNYKDPWPSANLVNGVDDGQYKEDNLYGQRGLLATNRLVRSSNGTKTNVRRRVDQSQEETCGERHKNTKPTGPGPLDANFAEYPWQAMILRDSNRSLLCGGAIIRRNAVLTAAHCVEGLDTSDVLIKGGEWKLGIDEEPLPFQIVKVGAILRHPDYVPGSFKNDLAVLVLREKLRPSKNVGTICLPESNKPSTANCVATGWGKRILQLHAKGAIMHHINVDVLEPQQCQQSLAQNFQSSLENYSPTNTLCGTSDIDHCKVDYGSALACANSDGQYTLTGIYAWDTGCKEEGQIGGYVAPDVEWIQSTLSKSIKELKKIEREYLLKTQT